MSSHLHDLLLMHTSQSVSYEFELKLSDKAVHKLSSVKTEGMVPIGVLDLCFQKFNSAHVPLRVRPLFYPHQRKLVLLSNQPTGNAAESADEVWKKIHTFVSEWLQKTLKTSLTITDPADNFVPAEMLRHVEMSTSSADCGGNLMTLDNPRTNPTPFRYFVRVGGGWRGFTTKSQAKAFYKES